MPLSDLRLKKIYRTKQDNITDVLIVPALKESVVYDRGTGYFTLDSLAGLADGLIPFIQHGGVMRVVTSVQLSEADVEAIKKGLAINETIVTDKIHEQIEEDMKDEDSLLKLDFITNLIAAGILVIRIAYLPDGIYHEKIGLLTDNEGGKLYFSGSNNATVSGLNKNWESVMLLTSWWGDNELIEEQQEYFNDLWKNDLDGLEVMSFPEAEEKNLIRKYKVSADVKSSIQRIQKGTRKNNKKKELYEYQKIAVRQFLENGGNHFFEMATGTGKTFTAVKAILALLKQEKKLSVVVLVPQIDLQAQWKKAFDEEGVKALFLLVYTYVLSLYILMYIQMVLYQNSLSSAFLFLTFSTQLYRF